MVLVQKRPFLRPLFLVKLGQEKDFEDILEGKKRLSTQ